MLCAFLVMKIEGFAQITDLADYLENNRIIAHYCGFNIMQPLPSYWTYDRFLRQLDNGELKAVMAGLVHKLYELGIVDASFIGLDSTPIAANTKQNNPKSFVKNKFSKDNHPKGDLDCALGVHTASNQHNEKNYEFYWGYKSHVLVDCISGLPLYEQTTPANVADSTVAEEILANANRILPIKERTFLADKGYDAKAIYNLVKDVYEGEAVFPLNKRVTKYQTIPDDYRLSIDRECLRFKHTYALHTECERCNSRFKDSGQERLWVRNAQSTANLNTLAHISALSVALAAVLTGATHSYCSKKAFRRTV